MTHKKLMKAAIVHSFGKAPESHPVWRAKSANSQLPVLSWSTTKKT